MSNGSHYDLIIPGLTIMQMRCASATACLNGLAD